MQIKLEVLCFEVSFNLMYMVYHQYWVLEWEEKRIFWFSCGRG